MALPESGRLTDLGKAIIFGQKLNFLGRSQQPKWKKKIFLYLLNEKKRNSFCLARISAQNPGFLLIVNGWGESHKAILQVSIAVSFGRCRKIFRAKMAQPPIEKLAHTPML